MPQALVLWTAHAHGQPGSPGGSGKAGCGYA